MSTGGNAGLQLLKRLGDADISAPGASIARLTEILLSSHQLSRRDLEDLSRPELEAAQTRLDALIANPGFLLRHVPGAHAGLHPAEWLSVASLLLDRKQYIIARTFALRVESVSHELEQRSQSLQDGGELHEIKQALIRVNDLANDLRVQSTIPDTAAGEARIGIDPTDGSLVRIQVMERKWELWRRILARESVAAIIGAFLLVFLTGVQVIAAFIDSKLPELLLNSYLILLGYFFGQTTSARSDAAQAASDGNTV